MANCKEDIADNKKRYLVALFYVELGDQNGTMKEHIFFAFNEHHALAIAIGKYGSECMNMPLDGYSVYHCECVLNSE